MASGSDSMMIDEILPVFDATIIEHLVIEAPPDAVFRAAREMDFLQVHSPLVDALMAARDLPARLGRTLRGRPAPPPPPGMRLADMFDGSADQEGLEGWVALGEVPGRELVFGAVGKIWQPNIEWKPVAPDAFRDFAEPDYAKICAGFSIRSYGAHRSLVSYEARTAGTDATAGRKFLRYWWLVQRFVQVVLRAALTTIKGLAEDDTTITRP